MTALPATHMPSLWQPTLQMRFEAWLDTPDGQAVYAYVRDHAIALRDRGWRHYGIAPLVERARYDHALRVGPEGEPWKINNDYRSRLARRLMEDHSELAGFFELRRTRA